MTQQDVFDVQTRFDDMDLHPDLLKGLQKADFEHPTHIQAQLIPKILAGRDVIGQAKTGTGKTAAFGLPIISQADADQPMQALIIAPTRELAIQIETSLNNLARYTPIRATAIVGGQSFKKQIRAIEDGVQIIVGTPGRIMDLFRRKQIHFHNIRWAVLDEVDRMLDIGFRDDIREILRHIQQDHQTVFVSATISPEIEKLARQYMAKDAEKIVTVSKSLTVTQVTQHYMAVKPWDKRRLLLHVLSHESPELTVVFCRMKQTVRKVAKYLRDKNIPAREIHGDLRQTRRNKVMSALRDGHLEVLVASDLAARGLDVEGITHIINYDLPEDPEVYIHRIGRTARVGRKGTAWSFVEPSEGQRLTEIEKLAGILIEEIQYPDFKPGKPPKDAQSDKPDKRDQTESDKDKARASGAEFNTANHSAQAFPSGIVPRQATGMRSHQIKRSGRRR